MSEEIDVETWLVFLENAMSDPEAWDEIVARLSEATGLSHEDITEISGVLYDLLKQQMISSN